MAALLWKEEVERDLQVLGMKRWRELVADRKKWKDIVRQAKAHNGLKCQWKKYWAIKGNETVTCDSDVFSLELGCEIIRKFAAFSVWRRKWINLLIQASTAVHIRSALFWDCTQL